VALLTNKHLKPVDCIWVVTPPGYIHSRAFDELALGLKRALADLSISVPIVYSPEKVTGRPLILGGHLLAQRPDMPCPEAAIVFNTEQVDPTSSWFSEGYPDLLRTRVVWDYSPANILMLTFWGIAGVKLCRIGYVPELTRIPACEPDVDVLFYGSLNDRREVIIDDLSTAGVRVKTLFGVYGRERDAWIARSRIVLNHHYYEFGRFEIIRVSYLLANRKCVVSETGIDPDLESPFREAVTFGKYDELVDICLRLLSDADRRRILAQRGFDIMSSMKQSDFLPLGIVGGL
jgi:hypothetical protein